MKKLTILFVTALLISSPLWAGVVKKSKSEIEFTKFGKFSSLQNIKLAGLKKMSDSDNKFKGKGIMGKLAGKFALKSGKIGEIIDLPEMTRFELDHKKKQYRINTIEKISMENSGTGSGEGEGYEESSSNSDVKITKNEFKVEDTGESKTINQFPSKKYMVTWLTEWENTRTGEKGMNRLVTEVWTTPVTGAIKQCQDEEQNFSQEHMKKIGLDLESVQQDILGTNWLALFAQMDESSGPNQDSSQFSTEMKKIEGYPVIIDGKFYTKKEGGEEEKEESSGGLKGKLGGLAKKALGGSKKNDGSEPAFTYYTELMEYRPDNIGDETFQVPSNYKKK